MNSTDKLSSWLRVVMVIVFFQLVATVVEAEDEYLSTNPPLDANLDVVVPAGGSVTFEVHSKHEDIVCDGDFTNAVGGNEKKFTARLKVKFAPAAQGESNPCLISMTRSGEPWSVKTVALNVIVPRIDSRTLHHAPNGTPDDRTDIGVGERVMMTVQPKEILMDSDVKWSIDGDDSLSNTTGVATIFTADFPKRGKKPVKIHREKAFDGLDAKFKNASDPMVVTFDDGCPKKIVRPRSNLSKSKSPRFIAVEDTFGERKKEYADKLAALDKALDAHQLSFQQALVALASMKTKPLGGRSQRLETHELLYRPVTEEINLVAKIVAMFHQPIDPKFNPDDRPVSSPSPPDETGLPSGASPEEIKDPTLRDKYEKAIAANDAKRIYFNNQYQAKDRYEIVERYAVNYLKGLCGQSAPELDSFGQALDALEFPKDESQKIMEEVKQSGPSKFP